MLSVGVFIVVSRMRLVCVIIVVVVLEMVVSSLGVWAFVLWNRTVRVRNAAVRMLWHVTVAGTNAVNVWLDVMKFPGF